MEAANEKREWIMAKTTELILFFVSEFPGVGRSKITLFLYTVDLIYRQYTGKPCTDLNYIYRNDGPFDQRIEECLDSLHQHGLLIKSRYEFLNMACWEYKTETANTGLLSLSACERNIVRHVAEQMKNVSVNQLLADMVLETKPMQDAIAHQRFNKPLRMDLVDNQFRDPTMDLETVWEAYEEMTVSTEQRTSGEVRALLKSSVPASENGLRTKTNTVAHS
jgi:Protein of unknown function (DUF4065)